MGDVVIIQIIPSTVVTLPGLQILTICNPFQNWQETNPTGGISGTLEILHILSHQRLSQKINKFTLKF